MVTANSTNPARGRAFEARVAEALAIRYNEPFDATVALPIGRPPKPHKFDLVSRSGKIACECKAYTWTVAGSPPSAKLTTLREAILYLAWLPDAVTKIIAVDRSTRVGKPESLGEYFVRLNDHLLGDITVLELAADKLKKLN